jgi:uncharacterized protein YdaU (DUF1376 family)
MKYFPHHIGDYASATSHLSNDEDICYRRLLDRYYDTELPLDPDVAMLARKCRVSQEVVQAILDEFFTMIDGYWHNSRADAEIARWYTKSEKARASVNSRWEEKRKNTNVIRTNNERNTNRYEQDTTQDPRPKTQDKTIPSHPDGFDSFWSAYPKKVGKPAAQKAFKAAKINGHLSEVIGDIESRLLSEAWLKNGGQFIPNPATYLNQRRWEDETTIQGASMFAGAI